MKKIKEYKYIIGIDEVGRGPLAGPVSVCACVIEKQHEKEVLQKLAGITDSKKLSEKKRDHYFILIESLKKEHKINYVLSHVTSQVIDKEGIQYAIRTALDRSLNKLALDPDRCFVYLDGGLYAPEQYKQETVIKGDSEIPVISIASVVAKVLRDRKMKNYTTKYPNYGFEKHKGYGTQLHRDMIKKYGVVDIHRKTWIK